MSVEQNYKNLVAQTYGATLVGVSKKQSTQAIEQAYAAGLRQVGENYWQEAKLKMKTLQNLNLKWHFIGRLQSSKIPHMVNKFECLQSLDQHAHAVKISMHATAPQKVFVQVNIAGEKNKGGVAPEQLNMFLKIISRLDNIVVEGLMSLPPLNVTDELKICHFKQLKTLQTQLGLKHLSVGTSCDWQLALQHGATMLRIGEALFGPRAC